MIAHDNPTRNFDNIALRIRSIAPDIVMMSNYGNEYMLLARTLYQQKVNVAGFYSILGGGFNYKFVKEMPDVSQYMMDVNHWFNPKSEQAQALKKRVEAGGALFTFEVYLGYSAAMLLADSLERAGSADKAKLTDALAQLDLQGRADALRADQVRQRPEPGRQARGHAVDQGRHRGDRARGVRLGQGGVPQAEALMPRSGACSTRRSSSPASSTGCWPAASMCWSPSV